MTKSEWELLQPVLAWAVLIAQAAPRKFSKYGRSAYVPRLYITALRDALQAAGFDWRAEPTPPTNRSK